MKLIPLHGRSGIVAFAKVDDEDEEWLSSFRWNRSHSGYARSRCGGDEIVWMHCLIAQPRDNLEVDHRDRDRLNNVRSNLRVVTKAQQQQNLPSQGGSTSGFRGVSFCKQTGRWRATVHLDGHQHSCGRHSSEIEAALAAERYRAECMPFAEPDVALVALGIITP